VHTNTKLWMTNFKSYVSGLYTAARTERKKKQRYTLLINSINFGGCYIIPPA